MTFLVNTNLDSLKTKKSVSALKTPLRNTILSIKFLAKISVRF